MARWRRAPGGERSSEGLGGAAVRYAPMAALACGSFMVSYALVTAMLAPPRDVHRNALAAAASGRSKVEAVGDLLVAKHYGVTGDAGSTASAGATADARDVQLLRAGDAGAGPAAATDGALLYHPFGRLSTDSCHSRENTEMNGAVVGWGPHNKKDSAAACCASCAAHNEKTQGKAGRCDAWVWCGRSKKECGEHYHECWLKEQAGHDIDTYETQAYGPSIPWTSGFNPRPGTKQAPDDNGAKVRRTRLARARASRASARKRARRGRSLTCARAPTASPFSRGAQPYDPPTLDSFRKGGGIHTVCTSNGNPYSNYQTRIMYGTYLRARAMPGGEAMRHFTRVLHRSRADILMDEVPTVRVHPRSDGECDEWCDFPVKDRPNAIKRWLETDDARRGEWILLVETDYVFFKPIPMPPQDSRTSYAFHFEYINTRYPRLPPLWRELGYEGNIDDIPCSGPAPVLMRFEDFGRVADGWQVYTHAIEDSEKVRRCQGRQ